MVEITTIADLPGKPAVYALYGGRGRGLHVAYVGTARDVRTRITQHLLRRDSSITTGAAVVTLNADLVTQVWWWEHSDFSDEAFLFAAELVAFDALDPVLRSRGQSQDKACQLYTDPRFYGEMTAMFSEEPTGRLTLPTLLSALERIAALEERLRELEVKISTRTKPDTAV
ncbi:MAG TPA: hypothetical protein VF812_03780 [Ktedonobacterales bacterium]